MNDRFKITGDEVNEVIFNSPYSLADSPAALGQRASQTKRYFYQFINTLAEKINLHLGQIDTSISECEDDVNEAYERISMQGEHFNMALTAHNVGEYAHMDIRQNIIDEKNMHNESKIAHVDIREAILLLREELDAALTLAEGKSRVMSFYDEIELFEYATTRAGVGDILLLEDSSLPDFTVYGVGVAQREGDIVLDFNDIATGTQLLPNKKYFIGGVRLASSEGYLETSIFAKKDELTELRMFILEIIDLLDSHLYSLEASLKLKEDAVKKNVVTGESVTLESMNEYHLGTVTNLTVNVTKSEFFEAILCFKTGSTEISVDAPSELLFVGDDTLDGRFYPVPKRLYEISVKLASGVLLARVGSVDYEVIS